MSVVVKKPYCSNCPHVMGSKEYNDCCENRIFWTEKFRSMERGWIWDKTDFKPKEIEKPNRGV